MQTDPISALNNYKIVNPAQSLPLIVHDGYKIMGTIDNFVKYLVNNYPEIRNQLFGDDLDQDLMDRYLQWISKVLEVQTKQI